MSDFIRSAMRQLRMPGVGVAIVQNEETVYAESFGVRRAGSDEPVTPVAALLQQFLLAVSMGSNCDRGRRFPSPMPTVFPKDFPLRAWNRRLQSCQDVRRLIDPIHHLFFSTQGGSK
jgi:hypothetical protein